MCMYVYVYVCICICVYIKSIAGFCTSMYTLASKYKYIHIHTYVCKYLWKLLVTHTQKNHTFSLTHIYIHIKPN